MFKFEENLENLLRNLLSNFTLSLSFWKIDFMKKHREGAQVDPAPGF